MTARSLLPAGVLLGLAPVDAPAGADPWSPPSLTAPLGADEFGRDLLLSILISTGRSLGVGLILAATCLLVSGSIAYFSILPLRSRTSLALRAATQVVESIPTMVWILTAYAALGSSQIIVGAAFVLVMIPFASTVIAGELERLAMASYVEAARALGASAPRCLVGHILPNASSVLGPLAVQIVGIAIAIRGAIGVVGFSNRTDYDLGVVLLRGKENVGTHPILIVSATVSVGLVYLYLDYLWRVTRPQANSGDNYRVG